MFGCWIFLQQQRILLHRHDVSSSSLPPDPDEDEGNTNQSKTLHDSLCSRNVYATRMNVIPVVEQGLREWYALSGLEFTSALQYFQEESLVPLEQIGWVFMIDSRNETKTFITLRETRNTFVGDVFSRWTSSFSYPDHRNRLKSPSDTQCRDYLANSSQAACFTTCIINRIPKTNVNCLPKSHK